MKRITTSILVLFLFSLSANIYGQYTDYIGAGHSDGITVTSSSDFENTNATNTINGSGMNARTMELSRFLSQATMGVTPADLELIEELGMEGWIDAQMALAPSEYLIEMEDIWAQIRDAYLAMGYIEDDLYGPWAAHFNYSWWTHAVTGEDQLRQRVAFALSQILVISNNSDLVDRGEALSAYYDLLMKHAFGNYRDLLVDIALNPSMGFYLTHLNNPKAIPSENIHPDENFARELMQLFTIGLYELNNDGTRKVDANGDDIPTYNNTHIKELAKVFTGLGPGKILEWVAWSDEAYFGLEIYGADMTVPMEMYEEFHERDQKNLLNGYIIPANNDPMKDITDAIDHLFNHPNVGPFISKQLIQRFVTSNPTPEYVNRIANVFNSNESGERGNLGSVIKAILMDEEARSCESINDGHHGKMREPLLRATQFVRLTPLDNPNGKFWNATYNFQDDMEQMQLGAPTVFNFYLPDHKPVGELSALGLNAPEFNLLNTRTAIGYLNQINQWAVWGAPWWGWDDEIGILAPVVDYDGFSEEMKDVETAITWLDTHYTNGLMTDFTRENIRTQISPLDWNNTDSWMYRLSLATYLAMISPDFVIQK